MLRLRTGLPGAVPSEPAAAGGTGMGSGVKQGIGINVARSGVRGHAETALPGCGAACAEIAFRRRGFLTFKSR